MLNTQQSPMPDKKRTCILIAGGDDRFVELATLYKQHGYDVATYGMEKAAIRDIKNHTDLDIALNTSNTIIAPIPFAKDVNILNTKYSEQDIEVDFLLSRITPDKTFLVGAMNSYSKEAAARYKVNYIDYYSDESYQILNTIPTAEGALAIMINETNTTLFSSKVMILGYGRIGKLLSEYTRDLGAETYVEARNVSDLTWIKAKGMHAVQLDKLADYIGEMDIIVNTIPALILDQRLLDMAKKEALLIDLASKPGGIDFLHAKNIGLKAIHALSLPGKIAYKSAALYIFETINRILTTSI